MKLHQTGVYLLNQSQIIPCDQAPAHVTQAQGKQGTMTYDILKNHNTTEDMVNLKLKFDSLTSHDLTYVGIIQTAKASGLERFPMPYVLTNCHNTLCAVGGTINEDDHLFGLSAAKKYGGIYLPPHIGVIHQYMREAFAGGGKMILGSDSHTRYGALGTMAIGEGGGELVKQILGQTYDIAYPDVVGIYLTGKPSHGVGPQDIAIALITAVFESGYVKNKVMEFIGPGVSAMSTDYRNGIDVMTTETTCLSSIWRTDSDTQDYLRVHGRGADFVELNPDDVAYYDGFIELDLSQIKPMIALPFHPSNGYTIAEVKANLRDILHEVETKSVALLNNPNVSLDLQSKIQNGKLYVDQGVIAGCAGGTYSNILEAAHILKDGTTGQDVFNLSVYPSSQAVMADLLDKGAINDLILAGATVRTAFCGPCFGAGDTPANGGLSIRHTTRNFPNREGSKPINGQLSSVALMDARSIAATAVRGGELTGADELDYSYTCPDYHYNDVPYQKRVYQGFGKPCEQEPLVYGPNIKDWPQMPRLNTHGLFKVAAYITDAVTTTDELIPSGETSSFRSNPIGLAQFTLSRRVPEYVPKAKEIQATEKMRKAQAMELDDVLAQIHALAGYETVASHEIDLSSLVYATKPGDGSAREQAASCQRVLGGGANIAVEYATKRYRSNLINWGMIPFITKTPELFDDDDYIFVPNVRQCVLENTGSITAYVLGKGELQLQIEALTQEEKEILLAGSLINYNQK